MLTETIKRAKFKRVFRGYSPREVDELLDNVVWTIEDKQREIEEANAEADRQSRIAEKLKGEIEKLESEVEKYKSENEKQKREIEKQKEIERENYKKVEEFKNYFVSLYQKQISCLDMLPYNEKNKYLQSNDQVVELE